MSVTAGGKKNDHKKKVRLGSTSHSFKKKFEVFCTTFQQMSIKFFSTQSDHVIFMFIYIQVYVIISDSFVLFPL